VKGYEVRSLFVVEDGMKYVSADAAALENRTVSDFTYKYDNGKFADLVLNGDSHSFNAKVFFPKETAKFDITAKDFNKDDPGFKPYRNKAKTGAYSLAYGASVKKFTKSLGLSERDGKIAYDNYWDANAGLKKFKEAVEKYWASTGQKTRVPGRDGRYLSVRSKHLLVNLCGQSLGACVMSTAFCIVDNKLGWLELDEKFRPCYDYKGKKVMRIAAFHDQGDFEADPEVAEEIGQMLVDGIKKAGTMLKMQVPLDGEFKVGNNAAEIH
jgi:DNA polymerase I-like protein with 3'-5' exonuclease and polymerase domains